MQFLNGIEDMFDTSNYNKRRYYIIATTFAIVLSIKTSELPDITSAEEHFEVGQSCGAAGYTLDTPIPEVKITKSRSRTRRAATNDEFKSWPLGRIPFTITDDFSSSVKRLIREAMNHWENETCVKFVDRTHEYDYVHLYKGNGCCSYVGRRGGKQYLSLGTGCIRFGIITHELGHVIGFWHEQNRPDRSIYIDVLYENMENSKYFNFDPRNLNEVKTFDQVYDFHSIMHYGNNFFTKNGGKTISRKVPGKSETNEIGMSYYKYEGPVLSPQDVLETNLLYRCTKITECGGTIFANSGTIESTNINKYHQETKDCVWIITTTIKEKYNEMHSSLTLIFNKFHVGKPSNDETGHCEDDYVEVREGKGFLSPFIVRYCGKRKPAPITTVAGSLYIRFHISGKNRKNPTDTLGGFNVSFKTDACSQLIKAFPAIIQSPQFPFGYQINTDCVWSVEAQRGMKIEVEFRFFSLRELDSEEGCLDYVEIHQDHGIAERFVGRFCGSNNPGKLIVNSERVKIHFHASNANHQGWFMGFEAEVDQYDIDECLLGLHECTQDCLNYPGGYFCGCYHGYDTVYHRDSRKAQCVDRDECSVNNGGCSHQCINTDGSFVCGCPKGFTISANKSTCQDVNECDMFNKPCSQICKNTIGSYECYCYEGYILQSNNKTCGVLSGCQGSFISSAGRIASPQIPSTYMLPVICVWLVQGAAHAQLTFDVTVSLEENNDCRSYITFYNNEVERQRNIYAKKVCMQSDLPEAFVMKTSSTVIEYVGQFPFRPSFKLEYHSILKSEKECLHTYNVTNGRIHSPGFPYQYSDEQDCLWNIYSPHRTIFKIIFLQFNLESHERCEFDYLDVEQIYYEVSAVKKIGRFCGDRIPETFYINGNISFVRISFHSDSTNNSKGFKLLFKEIGNVS